MRFDTTTQLGPHRETTLQSYLLWSLQRETLALTPAIKTRGYRGWATGVTFCPVEENQ